MQNEPLPCPFCGGEVSPFKSRDMHTGGVNIGGQYYLECYNDDCEVNPRIDIPHATEESIITAWNKREYNCRTVEPLDAN